LKHAAIIGSRSHHHVNISQRQSNFLRLRPWKVSGFTLGVERRTYRYAVPFRISGHVIEAVPSVYVTLTDDRATGRGEAAGVYYQRDNVDHMLGVLERYRDAIEACSDREALRQILPPGGARNALDCAMWEHESLLAGVPVWRLAGLEASVPQVTTFTLSADAPETLAAIMARFPSTQAIKLKLDGDFAVDSARVAAVRAVCPESWLGVDANQGYAAEGLAALIAMLADAKVSLLEQPVRRGDEAVLEGLQSPIPIAADESILSLSELEEKARFFNVVNIKLDKCGGLTEGLAMAKRARALGLGVMVGNMGGSTLATAPAFVLAQLCDHVDLDGPWFIADDEHRSQIYAGGLVDVPSQIWGATDQPQ
jgi:L-alanine-DL-glutamate epimerase-like enolase superfamily enzyme